MQKKSKTKKPPVSPSPILETEQPLSQKEEEKLLFWLGEGLDISVASILFKQEFNRELNKDAVLALWSNYSKTLHLARRNYFARLASALVDNKVQGEPALDEANSYLLKQTLFEALIAPEKNPKTIELLIKAIKTLDSGKNVGQLHQCDDKKTDAGVPEETLEKIEDIIRAL